MVAANHGKRNIKIHLTSMNSYLSQIKEAEKLMGSSGCLTTVNHLKSNKNHRKNVPMAIDTFNIHADLVGKGEDKLFPEIRKVYGIDSGLDHNNRRMSYLPAHLQAN